MQAPELLYETGSPAEDAAATLNCVLKVAPAGACVVTTIVWFAFALVRLKAVEIEPPLMLADDRIESRRAVGSERWCGGHAIRIRRCSSGCRVVGKCAAGAVSGRVKGDDDSAHRIAIDVGDLRLERSGKG